MSYRLRAGILVNTDKRRYEVVREDNGNLLDWVSVDHSVQRIMNELQHIEQLYMLRIVNKENLRLHLSKGLHPELAWRPGKRGLFRGLKETWWETGNIAHSLEYRRQGRRR